MKKRICGASLLAALALSCLCACGAPKQTAPANTPAPTATTTAAITDSQSLGLTSVNNARELGGYAAADGRKVKKSTLLRTAALGDASEADLKKLRDDYHLGTVLDFRMSSEVESKPDPEIEGVKNLNLRIIDEDALAEKAASLTEKDMEGSGEWFDLSKKPIERASFTFGGAENKDRGYFINDNCIGSGSCTAVCPQKCIASEGIPFVIEQKNCLHCGNCLEVCNAGAVIKRN